MTVSRLVAAGMPGSPGGLRDFLGRFLPNSAGASAPASFGDGEESPSLSERLMDPRAEESRRARIRLLDALRPHVGTGKPIPIAIDLAKMIGAKKPGTILHMIDALDKAGAIRIRRNYKRPPYLDYCADSLPEAPAPVPVPDPPTERDWRKVFKGVRFTDDPRARPSGREPRYVPHRRIEAPQYSYDHYQARGQ